MSYNIAAGHGNLDRIIEVIRSSGADVVALQEVDVHWSERSGFADQAALLGDALGMEVFYAPIYTLHPAEGRLEDREYGLAVLSRLPLREARNNQITRLSTQAEDPPPEPLPGFPEVVIEVEGAAVHLFNTHLDYRADPRVREMQVADMLRIMGSADRPTLLLGDLNAEPGDPELDPLFQRLEDVWSDDLGPGLTFPADDPVKRIDYILASSHFAVGNVEVLETEASDHCPVVADLLLHDTP